MSDNLYNPSLVPENPDCGKPPVPPCPPVPPPPDFPPFCPEDRPQMGRPHMPPAPPMPPVPSVVSGMDLYEAMNQLSDRVNVCIHNYNAVMAENYKTLHNLQRAAQENGAYYGPGEVWVEEGYNADEGATYHLIHKACVDRRGEPIRMQLHLAYGNTTNSKIEQPMFAASKVEFADKMVVAIPKGVNGWFGKAIWHGCPITSAEEETLWTVGFTQGGVMRVYNNGVTVDQMLRDTIENAMGVSGVLIQNGQICDESYTKYIPQRDEQASRVVMGQVMATREVVILTVGNENDVNRKGLTSATCAQILKQYGCDIAVELCEGSGSGAMDKGSLMYVPDDTAEPSMYAYWFISRKCFYKNDYERELAELVQNYGACLWQGFLNKKAIAKVKEELDAEIARAKAAEEVLQENIDKETERAKAEEQRLDGKIDDESARAKAAEQVLQENIDNETERAKAEEQKISDNLNSLTSRVNSCENNIAKLQTLCNSLQEQMTSLDNTVASMQKTVSTIESTLNEVKQNIIALSSTVNKLAFDVQSISSDIVTIQNSLDSEIQRATNRENELELSISNEVNRAKSKETEITGSINDITSGAIDLPYLKLSGGTMNGNLYLNGSPTSDTQAATKKYVDDLVAGGTSPGTDVSKEYVDNQIAAVNANIEQKVSKSGDTMTGSLNMATTENVVMGNLKTETDGVSVNSSSGCFLKAGTSYITVGNGSNDVRIKGLSTPIDNNDASNKKYVDDKNAEQNTTISNLSAQITSVSNNVTKEVERATNAENEIKENYATKEYVKTEISDAGGWKHFGTFTNTEWVNVSTANLKSVNAFKFVLKNVVSSSNGLTIGFQTSETQAFYIKFFEVFGSSTVDLGSSITIELPFLCNVYYSSTVWYKYYISNGAIERLSTTDYYSVKTSQSSGTIEVYYR